MNTFKAPPGTILRAPPEQPSPRLYRLKFCASQAGLSPEAFLQACQLGQLPVTVHRIGPRGYWHVDAKQFLTWMGDKAPAELSKLF